MFKTATKAPLSGFFKNTINRMKRPLSITIICGLSVINAGYMALQVLTGMASLVTPWYPLYLGVLIGAELLCALGLWNMQRWAAYLYCGILSATIGMGLWLGSMGLIPMLLSGYAIVTMLYFSKHMR